MEGLADWQSRPLDAVYAVVLIDAINVKIREGQVANRPIYLALGSPSTASAMSWACGPGSPVTGKVLYWLRVLTEIKNRGTGDVLMLVCDGLKGLPDAVSAVWEKAIVKHVLFISCGIPSSTRRNGTGCRSPKTSSPCTPPRPRLRRWTGLPSSAANGKSVTPPSYGSRRTPGQNSCHSFSSTGK
jgi:Transposase, Mutator family